MLHPGVSPTTRSSNGVVSPCYFGVTRRFVQKRTPSRNSNEISAIPNWVLPVAGGAWGRINTLSCSQPSPTTPQATAATSQRC
jgi:hypothetical protein